MAVNNTFDFHFSPPKLLYRRDDTYPAGVPKQTYKTSAHVIKAPRLAGLKNPRQANTKVINVINKTCTPDPTATDSSIPFLGGRKTSP
jgi:hypothetical protein